MCDAEKEKRLLIAYIFRNPDQPTNDMLRKPARAHGMAANDLFTAGLLVLTG
jgi:hypothetical protein